MTARTSNIAQAVTATAAAMALLYFLRDVLIPLVLALVLAVLVSALVRFIAERARGAPNWAVVALAALIVITCATAAILVFARGAANMVREAPALANRMEQLVEQLGRDLHLSKPLQLKTLIGDISVPQIAGSVAGGVSSVLAGLLLMITYFIFILSGRSRARHKLAQISTSAKGKPIEAAVHHIAADIETYLWVQTVTGVIIAGASGIIMFAVGLNNSLFWTIVLFLLCYIPMIGVTVGSIVPALFALLQFPSWWQSAVIFGGIQLVATIVGNFVYPRMQAETQNIDPVATLLSLAFWGFLWGLTGAFLAVPLTLMVMMICAYFPRTRWIAVLLSNDGRPKFPKADPTRRE
jgi:predicted PurR-regulated permease PerM